MARGSMPGERRGGRGKGTPNKTTAAAKEAIALAFEGVGGLPALIKWAKLNQSEFYKLYARLIPMDLNAEVSRRVVIVDDIPAADER